MPRYVYACDDCSIQFEIIQSINDLSVADCPVCNAVTKHRVPQPVMIFNKTPSTLGGYADQKRSSMGKYAYEDTLHKMANSRGAEYCGALPEGASVVKKEKTERPFYRPDRDTADLGLLKASPDQLQRYIQTGKRPIGTD